LTACNVRLSAPCVAGHAPKLTIDGEAAIDSAKPLRQDHPRLGDKNEAAGAADGFAVYW